MNKQSAPSAEAPRRRTLAPLLCGIIVIQLCIGAGALWGSQRRPLTEAAGEETTLRERLVQWRRAHSRPDLEPRLGDAAAPALTTQLPLDGVADGRYRRTIVLYVGDSAG